MQISPERTRYHELIETEFKPRLSPGSLIYDIGKSATHNYAPVFESQQHKLKSIDREISKNPDIVLDLETDCRNTPLCDAALFNGVTEQCSDPFKLIKGLKQLIKPNGLVLFGIVSLGYPTHEWDWFRFTLNGAKHYITSNGFEIRRESIVTRGDQISYVYLVANFLMA